jgi:Flp pilus assembly protein TadG
MGRRLRIAFGEGGQALLEFALILPVMLMLVFGLVEFSFVMNTSSSVNFASHDAAMLLAEGGKHDGADCVALAAIEVDLQGPAMPPRVQRVEVYLSDANGEQIGSAANVYERTGATTCDYGDGTTLTVPYTLTTAGYVPSQRCDVLAGCGAGHPTVDTIGVRITYAHQWATSFGRLIAGTVTFRKATAIRMEPTL